MLQQNKAKAALAKLGTNAKLREIALPPLSFAADDDATLRAQLALGQNAIKTLDPLLAESVAQLRAVEQDRVLIKERRWQAGFDLALGRLLSMQARTAEYEHYLKEMSATPQVARVAHSLLDHTELSRQ